MGAADAVDSSPPPREGGCRNSELFVTVFEDCVCPLGGGVITEPRRINIEGCGHEFCECCLSRWQSDCGNTCPSCRRPFGEDDLVCDKQAKLRVLDLTCYCDHKAKGCEWEGKFAYLPDHLNECRYTERSPCCFWMYGCDYVGTLEEIDHHLLDQAQHHLQLTCERLEAYGDNNEIAVKKYSDTPEIRQHGGLAEEQCEEFTQCVTQDLDAATISAKFRDKYTTQAWSVHKCLRAECDQQIQSVVCKAK